MRMPLRRSLFLPLWQNRSTQAPSAFLLPSSFVLTFLMHTAVLCPAVLPSSVLLLLCVDDRILVVRSNIELTDILMQKPDVVDS